MLFIVIAVIMIIIWSIPTHHLTVCCISRSATGSSTKGKCRAPCSKFLRILSWWQQSITRNLEPREAAQVTWPWCHLGSSSRCSLKEEQRGNPCAEYTQVLLSRHHPKCWVIFQSCFSFFLTFLPDWNNGRPLCGQHNLRPQFFQASGKY